MLKTPETANERKQGKNDPAAAEFIRSDTQRYLGISAAQQGRDARSSPNVGIETCTERTLFVHAAAGAQHEDETVPRLHTTDW